MIGQDIYTIYCYSEFLPNMLIQDFNVSRETFSRFRGGMFHVKQLIVVFEKGFTSTVLTTTIYSRNIVELNSCRHLSKQMQ